METIYIKREMEQTLSKLVNEYACIILAGARQVGKSTMLKHLFEEYSIVTLDDLQERNLAKQTPKCSLKSIMHH